MLVFRQLIARTVLSLSLILLLLCPALAFLGTQIEDAQRQDFFSFFRLLEAGRTEGKDGSTMITFKPLNSPKFKDLATVHATTDKGGKILAIDLQLARSFIEDRTNGIFARDIAGSFISGVAGTTDTAAVKDLVNEIKFPKDTGGTLILTGTPPPKVPDQPTDGYSTYLGKRKDFEQILTGKTLSMENRNEGGAEILSISAVPK